MKINKLGVPFAQVANEILNDCKLSWRAKGIFAYMQSKPDGWDFDSGRMSDDSKDGVDSTRIGINELITCGYLTRQKLPNGRMEYTLHHTKATLPKSQRGKKPEREIPAHKKERIYILGEQEDDGTETTETQKKSESIENKSSYLKHIPEQDVEELTDKFDISRSKLLEVGEELYDYCLSRGKRYKNYKAFLRNCVRKKSGYRPQHHITKLQDKPVVETESFDPSQFRPDFVSIAIEATKNNE